jgi:hypothetical protein
MISYHLCNDKHGRRPPRMKEEVLALVQAISAMTGLWELCSGN